MNLKNAFAFYQNISILLILFNTIFFMSFLALSANDLFLCFMKLFFFLFFIKYEKATFQRNKHSYGVDICCLWCLKYDLRYSLFMCSDSFFSPSNLHFNSIHILTHFWIYSLFLIWLQKKYIKITTTTFYRFSSCEILGQTVSKKIWIERKDEEKKLNKILIENPQQITIERDCCNEMWERFVNAIFKSII